MLAGPSNADEIDSNARRAREYVESVIRGLQLSS